MAVGETASLREATVTVLTVVGGGAGTPCDAAPCVRVWRSSGRYHETYYLWLRLHHDSDRFVLARYTVPPVVPIMQLARELLDTDLTVRIAPACVRSRYGGPCRTRALMPRLVSSVRRAPSAFGGRAPGILGRSGRLLAAIH